MKCLVEISKVSRNIRIGNKALWLSKLEKKGYPIPATYVVPVHVHRAYSSQNINIEHVLRLELEKNLNNQGNYAVRSSGEFEDSKDYSFAGQMLTELDVKGIDNIIQAIKNVWKSGSDLRNKRYGEKASIVNTANPLTGVIIQEMVKADWSGVSFSLNPVSGFDETIIEGIKGRGDAFLQDGQTPKRWVYKKGTCIKGEFSDSPGEDKLTLINTLVSKIKKQFRLDIDVEWVVDQRGKVYLLQCRPVTVKKFPEVYSNHISREVLPGIIKPLVWSVNIPLVNAAWIKLLEQILGSLKIKPEDLSKSFYYRAYFNMGTLGKVFAMMGIPANSLERLMGIKHPGEKKGFRPGLRSIKYLPGMLAFIVSNVNLGKKFLKELEEIRQRTNIIKTRLEHNFKVNEFKSYYDEIITLSGKAAYFNILIPLIMMISSGILKKQLDKKGISIGDLDFSRDFPELKDYDPQCSLNQLAKLWQNFGNKEMETIVSITDFDRHKNNPDIKKLYEGIINLLDSFGHLSESGNDFSYKTWSEDPDFLIDIIRKRSEAIISSEDKKAPFKENISFNSGKYRRAGRYRIYREKISSEYTRCYGLLRDLFLLTGKHIADQGYINDTEDVFYMDIDQHNRLLINEEVSSPLEIKAKIKAVKDEIKEFEDIQLPPIIYGDLVPPVAKKDRSILEGIPSSPGFFRGKIVVIKGYQDFHKNVENAILVIPFSDVGWTPIMVSAGAIVSESGGLLSHTSIIARELGIPAIVSVENACTIKDGTHATVDANNGILLVNNK